MEKYEGVKCFRLNPRRVGDFLFEVGGDLYTYCTYDEYVNCLEILGGSPFVEEE